MGIRTPALIPGSTRGAGIASLATDPLPGIPDEGAVPGARQDGQRRNRHGVVGFGCFWCP